MARQILECVPNFSEGRDLSIIKQITDVIEAVEGVQLLDVDPGAATNRTVVTFVGEPQPVINAAFAAMQKAAELIDMSKHQGEHPRMGATDVCPLIPIANITMDETVQWAHKLAKRAGEELDIPIFLYEFAATSTTRKNLATIRAGEYEKMESKVQQEEWKPDYGPTKLNNFAGVTAVGARDFLIAYNVNLNTTSVRRANSVAFDVREKGRLKREGEKLSGKILTDANGEPLRQPGMCKSVKGIGWFIEEYGVAQISMNLTNIRETTLHEAYEACYQSANKRGLRVTGSELVGLVPLEVMLEAGRYFLRKQRRSVGVSEAELIKIAVKSLGLDELGPFDPQQKIIEYRMKQNGAAPLLDMDLSAFANETASESPAPGGGSISAYVGALGAALATMVANLSSHKRDWDERWEEFGNWAAKGQASKQKLLALVDEDTQAFNGIMAAFRLPKSSDQEKKDRSQAIQDATRVAIEVPLEVMKESLDSFEVIRAMADIGNPNSASDAGVGALCARAAVHGAFLNVQINAPGLKDKDYVQKVLNEGQKMIALADQMEGEILQMVRDKI
ncbi:MAG: glutamate formimidoyltransferase [Saprospiraceae bacterium]|nr:glutamate formimidoyltransferase [Saprospiraceae bacterium]